MFEFKLEIREREALRTNAVSISSSVGPCELRREPIVDAMPKRRSLLD
jgi:hypothetical protein